MSRPNVATLPTSTPAASPDGARPALRLRLGAQPGRDRLDGGWWPHSRDLTVELADLVDHFPVEAGHVIRAVYSPPDWDAKVRRVPVARGGYLKAGCFPDDDTHLLHLRLADGRVLKLLVVPSSMTSDQGDEALLAAATGGNTHTAASLLDTVAEHPDVDPQDHWKRG